MGLAIGVLVAIVAVVIVLLVMVIAGYNGLVRARNAYKNAFAQIDVQMRRRFDLIPNLVETARAYMAHERQTLEAVVNARNMAMAGLSAAQANPGIPLRCNNSRLGSSGSTARWAGSSRSPKATPTSRPTRR
ncbi:hypothetical protein NIIDMKKI_24710 [Mycobacterium kansasii]|uniref:LemA family protein n=1 Tax=Mycobacterium kansasii TaxID=1768 RepID=A0A7G1IC02_MYCKA|nr:hypothetical protein NIIDMKKI_24710 [Mycobacterium kansasii]